MHIKSKFATKVQLFPKATKYHNMFYNMFLVRNSVIPCKIKDCAPLQMGKIAISKHFATEKSFATICILEILFVTLQRKLNKKHVLSMKKAVCYILLLLLSMGSTEVMAAKAKPLTKRYRNEKLIVILNDLCHRNGYTLNIVDEIDRDKRITAEFKNAKPNAVLRKVLDKDYQASIKKGVLTITRKPAPPTTYTVAATTPSQIIDEDSLTRTIYIDTVYTIRCAMKTIEQPAAPQPEPKKAPKEDTTGVNRLEHNIQVLLGGGYSSMGYNLGKDGRETGSFGASVQLRYLYYFTPNWGVGAGVGFANYGSTGTLNTTTVFTPNRLDSENEDYEHRVVTHDWQEAQRAYMVDVPIMVQCTYPIPSVRMKSGPLKIYADLGADLGFTIAASRRLKGGSIDHTGWYKPWKLELEDIPNHDFYSEQASDFETGSKPLKLRLPAVGIMADFGFAIPLMEHLDLLVGVYANYTANDLCSARQDIGWQQPAATGYRAHDFMNTYDGLIGTQYAASVHPWQAGVRVGINFNTATKRCTKQPDPLFKRINICDTTTALQERVETTRKAVVVQKIKKMLDKSVIWFDLNSSEPKLKPADILVKVAEVLKENPTQKILVTGHASRDGDKERNQRLSEARAQAVVDILLQLGVPADQMESRGEGVERDYIQGSHDISLDRRVEITPVE